MLVRRSGCAWIVQWSVIASIYSLAGTAAQGLDNLKKQALEHPGAYSILEQLTDGIGPRLTGSAQEARADQWALATMRNIGLQNVHSESWQLERGWKRGYARARLVDPFPLELTIASRGWTGSIPRGERVAEIIQVDSNRLADEARKNSSKWADKVLFIAPKDQAHEDLSGTLSQLPAFLASARASGAVAVIDKDSRPGVMMAHTGPALNSAHPLAIAFASVAREQGDLITRLLNTGTRVHVRIDIHNEFSPTAVPSNNIVGEIPGSLHPEEIVILGAHLDSWDQGTGAVDDGFGVAAVLGAAQSIKSSGGKPQRTIRFILFTGEEQGLLGSRAYVTQHQAEMKNVVCAIVLDWGSGPITKFLLAGHDEFVGPWQDLFRTITAVATLQIGQGYLTYTDAFSFILAGVPGIEPFQNSPDYMMVGHSPEDTLDKVDPDTLAGDSALLALSAFWIANYPVRVGVRWSPGKTAEMLSGQRDVLLRLGFWPF